MGVQFALREAVGTRTLDELLGDKGVLDSDIGATVRAKVGEHGLAIHSVGVKDVTAHVQPLGGRTLRRGVVKPFAALPLL